MDNRVGSGFHHLPVLPDECIEALKINPNGIYVDGTLGGGGHSSLIINKLTTGQLVGIDKDETALVAATARINGLNSNVKFTPVRGNFHNMPEILQDLNIATVDGILIDLGVSSHQLDTGERGFSYRLDGPLDMRMDNRSTLTAYEIVNNYEEKEIADILFTFGEERRSRHIAKTICKTREKNSIESTKELADLIEFSSPRRKPGETHPATRSFMALRIAVNDELNPLYNALATTIEKSLKPGGRIAVITFHSLEDRIVKNVFQKLASPCECPRDIPYCVCGKEPLVKKISKKPILPSNEELKENNRAHSAKLRVAERT